MISFQRRGHTFFAKAYQKRLVLPNKVTVASQTDDSPAYTGNATDAASFALLPKQEFHQMRLASDAEAAAVAAAIIGKARLQAEGGSGVVPMNVGAEVYDYVNISDGAAGGLGRREHRLYSPDLFGKTR